MRRFVTVAVKNDDVTAYPSDTLVLKYAQDLYGADAEVYNRLKAAGIEVALPDAREWSGIETKGAIGSPIVVYVGVDPLPRFGYPQIREFARTAISAVADAAPVGREVALTIHGVGYGLDPIEAFESEVAGVFDALKTGRVPKYLERITFVERDGRRAADLSSRLETLVPQGKIALDDDRPRNLSARSSEIIRTAGYNAATKPLLFVAMPFKKEMEDVFEFGILRPAKKCGFLCERVDSEWFDDNVLERIKERISKATVVLAELTGANPNVFLELGYAWGQGRRTILAVQTTDAPLPFDVRAYNVIVYESLKDLEQRLKLALKSLS